MFSYPELTIRPSVKLEEEFEDVLIKSEFEAGYELVRPRYTRSRRTFTFSYEYLPNTDKSTLESFYFDTLVFGTYTFTWTHPKTSVKFGVRFLSPPKFTYKLDSGNGYWETEIKVREP